MEIQVPLIIFTLLFCLASGIMGFQGYYLLTGKGDRRFHMALSLVGLVVIAVGGLASLLHLKNPLRIFNGFGHITSGITHEIIAVVIIAAVLIVVFALLYRGRGKAEARPLVPKAVGVVAIVAAVLMGFICAHSYDMYARPAWGNLTLYLYYYSSELVLGILGTWLVAAITKQADVTGGALPLVALVLSVVSGVVAVICAAYISTIDISTVGIAFWTLDPTAPAANPGETLSSPLSGAYAPVFWGGAVVVGALVPAVLSFLAKGREQFANGVAVPAAALGCALAGGICYRVCLYVVAIASYVYF